MGCGELDQSHTITGVRRRPVRTYHYEFQPGITVNLDLPS
jgi:hypothetical protein